MNRILGCPGGITPTSLNYAGAWAEGLNDKLICTIQQFSWERVGWTRKFLNFEERSGLVEYRVGYFCE